MWGPSANELYVGASRGVAFHYDGKKWSARRTGAHLHPAAFFGVGERLFLTGAGGERVAFPTSLLRGPENPAPAASHRVEAVRPGPMWPAPSDCHETCKTADGHAGLRCSPHGKCNNPCNAGMAILGGAYCVNECKSDKDCFRGDSCNPEGLCEPPQSPETCSDGTAPGPCETKNQGMGYGCPDACIKACPGRLVLVGGTHCGKPCKSDRDCPGGGPGACEGVCQPLCPNGCPYLWGN